MQVHRLVLVSSTILAFAFPAASGESRIAAPLVAEGYVSVPVERGADRRLYIEGMVHGEALTFMIDFSNDGVIFDTRALRGIGVELTKTERTIPTPRKTVVLRTGEILGLEFAGKSTPRATVIAGDVDAIYNVRPGTDGPDAVLGTEFLKSLAGVFDLETMTLYLKLR